MVKKGIIVLIGITLVVTFTSSLYIEEVPSLRAIYSRSSDRWPTATLDSGVVLDELAIMPPSPLDLDDDSVIKKVELGKTLFFDPRLSGSNQISCSSCHTPELGWADGRTLSVGHDHQRTKRNAPSIENVWYRLEYFWDGRAKTLQQQAESPIKASDEMHQDFGKLPHEIRQIKGYRALFKSAYGDPKVTGDRITKALATFQLSIVTGYSDFDYFLAGNSDFLSDEQILGLHLFRTKARCLNCHNGPFFTDNLYHNLNVTLYKDSKRKDLGLYNVTGKQEDVGKFRTPGLRNVTKTAPYFHNGLFLTLETVMAQYNSGMGMMGTVNYIPSAEDPMQPVVSPHIQRLDLTTVEISAIISFLESLKTSRTFEIPDLPK